FGSAHVPGSVNVALSGQFASWAARVLGLDSRVILLAEDEERVRESQMRLARVGMEKVCGYVRNGIVGWIGSGGEVDYIPQISAREVEELRAEDRGRLTILDVREA